MIVISGPDCVGKTTQIERLLATLRLAGEDPILVWYRPGYSRELDAVRTILRRNSWVGLPNPGPNPDRAKTFKRPWVRRAWVAVAILDMVFQYAVKVRFQLLSGRTVVCDRYIPDGFIDLSLRFPELVARGGGLERLVRVMCPRPKTNLLLVLSHDELLQRIVKKEEPFPDSAEIRRSRWAAYELLAETENMEPVQASGTVEEVHARVLTRLGFSGWEGGSENADL